MGYGQAFLTRFLIIGGFFGSGKTTTILRLANSYVMAGKRVGIIANDLGQELVDTQTYLLNGFPVEEVTGVCFACKFDELIAATGRLQDGYHPDILLTEPAGSCTDIVSKVIEPLKHLYPGQLQVAPYVTILDPKRTVKALTGKGLGGLSAKVTYLYKMQQNEADIVAINKTDILSSEELKEIKAIVFRNFPKADVMYVSARTGEGFEDLIEVLDTGRTSGANPIAMNEFNQNLSRGGEACLGWVNAKISLKGEEVFDGNQFLLDLATAIQGELTLAQTEPGHVKMILSSEKAAAIVNLVSNDRAPELSLRAKEKMINAHLIVNARVEVDPGILQNQVKASIEKTASTYHLEATFQTIEQRSTDPGDLCCDLPETTSGEAC